MRLIQTGGQGRPGFVNETGPVEMLRNMPKIPKILLLAVSVALVLTVFLGVNSNGVSAAASGQDGAYRQINVYSEVLRHIQTDYVTDPNIPAVTNGALRGLLESLDADSSYLSPEDYKAYKADQGGKAQAGINVSKRYGYATVVSVVPGGPADKAGLVDGDILEAIEGQDTRDISLAMIRLMLEGAPGSTLTVGVVRSNRSEPDKISMTRSLQAPPPVGESLYENASILYLKPEILDRDHVSEVETKLKGMQKAGNKKVLLDLRDAAAGDMAEAVRLANFLLKSGTIATLEGQKFPKQVFTADPAKTIQATAPVVVLVNRGTAGPAELVAAALRRQQARRRGGRADLRRRHSAEDLRSAGWRGADPVGGQVRVARRQEAAGRRRDAECSGGLRAGRRRERGRRGGTAGRCPSARGEEARRAGG